MNLRWVDTKLWWVDVSRDDYLRGAFFLPATVFLRPFLVRAFVRVRWPRTGSPRR